MTPEVLTLKETCRRLGLSYSQGIELLKADRFPVNPLPRIGRAWRFSSWQIDQYLGKGDTAA